MLKLLICLLSSLVLSLAVLQLRQQRRELSYQSSRLYTEIEAQQEKLWSQQLEIATYTSPNSIAKTVIGDGSIRLVPRSPLPAGQVTHWLDVRPKP